MPWGLWSYLGARPCPGPRLPGSSEECPSSPANCKLLSLKVQHLKKKKKFSTRAILLWVCYSFLPLPFLPLSLIFQFWTQITWLIVFLLLHVLSHLSHVRLFATPWTVAHQAPPSMGFSRQEYWSGLPLSRPGHLPNPGIQPMSLKSPALAGGFFTTIAKS